LYFSAAALMSARVIFFMAIFYLSANN